MRWFDRHLDASLEPWALGELTSSRASRLLRHAHTCERCGRLYEQWARAHRMLENRDVSLPTAAEGAALMASGLEAALAAAAPPPMRVRWPALVPMLGTVAAACVVLLLVRPFTPGPTVSATPGTTDWQSRGVGVPVPGAVLRVFCAAPGQALRELGSEDTCPPGAQLAFAVGAESPLSHVAVLAYKVVDLDAVKLRGRSTRVSAEAAAEPPSQEVMPLAPADEEPWRQKGGPFLVGGRPGQETPLEWTLRLPSSPDKKVVVEAAFASGPQAALQGLLAPRSEVKGVVRRISIRLQEAP